MKDRIKKDIERFKGKSETIVKVAYKDAEKYRKDWQPESSKDNED